MKFKKLVDSFNNAIEGIIYSVRTQRNMRIHMVVALIVLASCFVYDLSKFEFLALALTITLVMFAELINTAIESVVDMMANYYHPLAKIAKNVAAGAVLLTAINALVVGYVIFWDKITDETYRIINVVKTAPPYIIFIILVMICIVTVIIKAIFGEGTPLKGGMPSGHSALAFSLATAIALITEEPICILLSYLMALITAQSRVDSEVHSVSEVVVGAIVGTLLTVLIYKFLA